MRERQRDFVNKRLKGGEAGLNAITGKFESQRDWGQFTILLSFLKDHATRNHEEFIPFIHKILHIRVGAVGELRQTYHGST